LENGTNDAPATATMRPLLAVALVAAAASTASAGPYLGLGIGTSASVDSDRWMFSSDGNRTGRLFGGQTWGRFSVEGQGTRYSFFSGSAPYDATSLAVAAKYSFPLGDDFEVFGRGGLQHTWLNTDTNQADVDGNGLLLGAGFEYRLKLSIGAGSLFVDYQYDHTSFDAGKNVSVGGSAGMWTLGATVAL
jgi:opacity protein-like surface antigen